MALQIGIIGLPNVGKSTLFNALARAAVPAENYPFCTIDPNVGVAAVPDARLKTLGTLLQPEKLTPATIEFVDIAGLVPGASRGEGLGNQFLAHIREVDALLQVVRGFDDDNVANTMDSINPLQEAEIVQTELLLADLQTVEKALDRTEKLLKTGERKIKEQLLELGRVKDELEKGIPLRDSDVSVPRELPLMTQKPMLYLVNVAESDAAAPGTETGHRLQPLQVWARDNKAGFLCLSAKIEAELSELPPEDQAEFLADLGLPEPGLHRVICSGQELLGLLNFYTIKGPETRAWQVPRGTTAPKAAGRIHSDMERGFIRAEAISHDILLQCGSFARAKEEGLLRSEGRDYVMQDGDVVLFRFNV